MRPVTHETLETMGWALAHRGPDGDGTYLSDDRRMGLSHRRLAIVDIAGGKQPMSGPSGTYLVFNGEIYNYPALRTELERSGAVFRTRCDTEVILHLYARYGERCVDLLEGQFAFALWDPQGQKVFFARDHVGEKPLYWAVVQGVFIFASEIKAILTHPQMTPVVNRNAIAGYLTDLVSQSPETLFSGIMKLPPGTRGVCDSDGVTTERFWKAFDVEIVRDVSLRESVSTVRQLLERSVSMRMMSDVPVGVLLSGGLDSTALLALLGERVRQVPTFSVGTSDDATVDERAEARWVSRYFSTDHYEIEVKETDAMEFLPELIHHQDEPIADPVCIPLHFVCRLARNTGVPVVLAGEGADELFWGYPAYSAVIRHMRLLKLLHAAPMFLRRSLPALSLAARRRYAYSLAVGALEGEIPALHSPLGYNRVELAAILDTPISKHSGCRGRGRRADFETDMMYATQRYEFLRRLPELLLMRIDKFAMANSVEARAPFLDPRLVEFVYHLPLEQKMNRSESKIALRAAVSGIVPERVLRRKKQGFGAPILRWFEGNLGTVLESLLPDAAIREYFDTEVLEGLLRRHRSGDSQTFLLWPILNFALWHKHWIEGADVADAVALRG